MKFLEKLKYFVRHITHSPALSTSNTSEPSHWVNARYFNDKIYFLRFCLLTGDIIWEDKISSYTKLYRSRDSAAADARNYAVSEGMKNVMQLKVLDANISEQYNSNTHCIYFR